MNESAEGRELKLPRSATRGRLRAFVLLAITLLGLWLCYRLIAPFLPALTWALALGTFFMPAHCWVEGKLKWPNLAALVSVALIASLVVAPVLLLGDRLIEEAIKGAALLQETFRSGEWRQTLRANRFAAPVTQLLDQLTPADLIERVRTWTVDAGASRVRGWIWDIVTILIAFYLLFYFLRDRRLAAEAFRDLSPLSTADTDLLLQRTADAIYATLYGTVAVAVVQGALGAAIFWWLDLPAPLLWGLVMGLLAIVPVLGAFIIWVPTALFLALSGDWGKAVTLALWGAVVIGGIDNLLYPMLVGERLKLHTVPAFIAIVGGLIVFGPSGLLLGPVVVTVTLFAIEILRARIPPKQTSPRSPVRAQPTD